MTNTSNRPHTGPLPQKAPDAHSHSHFHTHSNRHPYALQHKHWSSDDDDDDDDDDDNLDSSDASNLAAHLNQRQDPNANDIDVPVTQVVQTISLVQYVDPSGNPLEIQTLYAPPATVLIDPSSGNTVAIAPSEDAATPAAPAAGPGASDAASNAYSAAEAISLPLPLPTDLAPISSVLEPIIGTAEVPLTTALPTETTSIVAASSSESVDESTAPLPSPPTFPSLSTPLNTTNTHSTLSLSLSHSFSHNSTRLSVLAYSTTDSASLGLSTTLSDTTDEQSRSQSSFLSRSAHATISSDFISTLASDSPTSTTAPSQALGGVGNSNGNGAGGQDNAEDSSSSSGSSGSGELSPEHQQVIGGVVGGVAGAAIFVLLVFMLLRRRRRRNGELPFSTQPQSNSRSITEGGADPAMSERAAPAAVMAALSLLTGQGKKRQEEAPPATGEKGFYRVSGRKLPSVLQSGGDGYTDPRETNPQQMNTRESVMSGYSDYYRGSQEFDPSTGGVPRLALGSPMRPISGVPIMREGPGRKVSVPENPFAEGDETDPFLDPPASQPSNDPLGRSLIGQDSSRGSGSRFQERL